MIHEVDEALRGLLDEQVLAGSGVEISFEAPTRDWAARRNAPTVNVFLYDIREDLSHRQDGTMRSQDADGRVVAEFEPPRWYNLSYLVTAWTNRAQDEHRLLAVLLSDLIRRPVLPRTRLTGSLVELELPVPLTVAVPPVQERGIADIWSAIGGALKPSLDLVIIAPLTTGGRIPAPLVTDGIAVDAVDIGTDSRDSGLALTGTRRARGPVQGSRPIPDLRSFADLRSQGGRPGPGQRPQDGRPGPDQRPQGGRP